MDWNNKCKKFFPNKMFNIRMPIGEFSASRLPDLLDHGDAKVFMVDTQFSPTVKDALVKKKNDILVIDIEDPKVNLQEGEGDLIKNCS